MKQLLILVFIPGIWCSTTLAPPIEHRKDTETCCAISDSTSSPRCSLTNLVASPVFQLALTPNYPNRFPIDKLCAWTIRCRKEHRIRLEFRDFYLIKPAVGGCVDQALTIWSPLSNLDMGPFCGNSGLPSIVSAGNLLVVRLKSEIPSSGEEYRGFTMAFRETSEDPTIELKAPNWHSNKNLRLNEAQLIARINSLQPRAAPTIPPARNNGAILPNAAQGTIRSPPPSNRSQNNRPRRPNGIGTRPQRPNRPSGNDNAPTFARSPNQQGQRNRPRQPSLYGPNQRTRVVITGNRNNKPKENKSSLPLPIEVLVGIGIGGVVLIAFLIFLLCCIRRNCKQRKKTPENEVSTPNTEPTSVDTGRGTSIPSSVDHPDSVPRREQGYKKNDNHAYVHDNSYLSYPPVYTNPHGHGSLPVTGGHNPMYQQQPPYAHNYGQYGGYATMPQQAAPPVMLYDPATGSMFNSMQLQVIPPNYQPAQEPVSVPVPVVDNGRNCAIPATRDRSRPKRSRQSRTSTQQRTQRTSKAKSKDAPERNRSKRRRTKRRR
uniref:CUB domain-containing protein n=1 Tax=Ciona savignyi TaxID=51511 RepID=H2ZLC7_CIOSA